MELPVLGLMLLAAATHALWNAWLKQSDNRLITLAMMSLGWAVVALAMLPFVGAPEAVAWPFIAASTAIHVVYALVLVTSYRFGDLSVAYPIARGTGPVIVTLVSVTLLGEYIGVAGIAAIGLIVGGVMWLGGIGRTKDYRALLISLLAGCLIGAYTLVDGLGGRAGASPHTYAVWLFLLCAATIAPLALLLDRAGFRQISRMNWRRDFVGGVISVVSYWIAIWAMSVAPMPLVAAVRESSVAFAALFGGVLLKERVNWRAVAVILAGVFLVRLAGSQ